MLLILTKHKIQKYIKKVKGKIRGGKRGREKGVGVEGGKGEKKHRSLTSLGAVE